MASAWNRNPAAFKEKVETTVETKDAIQLLLAYSAAAAGSALLPSLGSMVSVLLGFQSSSFTHFMMRMGCWMVSLVCTVRALNTFFRWRSTQGQGVVQSKMAPEQRKLFGLAPPAPKVEGIRQRKPLPMVPPAAASTPAMSPPQRWTPLLSSTAAPDSMGRAMVDCRTPMTGSTSLSRPSPRAMYSGSTIATPQQLQYYLDNVGGTMGAGPGSQPPSPAPMMWRDGMPGGYGPSATSTPMQAHAARSPTAHSPVASAGEDSGYAATQQQLFPTTTRQQEEPSNLPVLPVGSEAPKYRPSWLPRVKTVVHTPDVLSLSTDDEINEVVSSLLGVARRDWMELWTENLREWFSLKLLRPLLVQVCTAHESVNKVLLKYNQPHKLPPIPDVTGPASVSSTVDMEALVRHMQQWCNDLHRSGGPSDNTPQAIDAQELAKALVRYDQLILLLRGKRPADLLPPAPAGYMWSRIQELANGTCMPEFKWNGGGMWAGRPWSADLPTDSLLVLYLLAGFLDAPGWEFPLRPSQGNGSVGMPLFLGQLKSRPPNRYSAILSYRPDKPSKDVDAILALNMSASTLGGSSAGGPMMCFLVEGRILALSGYQAMFHIILFFLLYHKKHCNSTVGNHYLHDQAMGLASVIEPPLPGGNKSAPHSVFGWWFPPTAHDDDSNAMPSSSAAHS